MRTGNCRLKEASWGHQNNIRTRHREGIDSQPNGRSTLGMKKILLSKRSSARALAWKPESRVKLALIKKIGHPVRRQAVNSGEAIRRGGVVSLVELSLIQRAAQKNQFAAYEGAVRNCRRPARMLCRGFGYRTDRKGSVVE